MARITPQPTFHEDAYLQEVSDDANVYYLYMEEQSDIYFKDYQRNFNNPEIFTSFLHDVDTSDPVWVTIHGQMNGDFEDKAFAYDLMMTLFESYVEGFTEMFNE